MFFWSVSGFSESGSTVNFSGLGEALILSSLGLIDYGKLRYVHM